MRARSTTLVGLLRCLPAAIIYPLLMLHSEPPFAYPGRARVPNCD